jgi:hypothetical protein
MKLLLAAKFRESLEDLRKLSLHKKSYLYLVELGDRTKIGISSNVFKRVTDHDKMFKAYSGGEVGNVAIFDCSPHEAWQMENKYVSLLSDFFPVVSGKEWFDEKFHKVFQYMIHRSVDEDGNVGKKSKSKDGSNIRLWRFDSKINPFDEKDWTVFMEKLRVLMNCGAPIPKYLSPLTRQIKEES